MLAVTDNSFSLFERQQSRFISISEELQREVPNKLSLPVASFSTTTSPTAFATMTAMNSSIASPTTESVGEQPVEFIQNVLQQPRSAGEIIYDSSPKYRQLPCRTFISVGTCPYRERCVYLHDPRIICREAKTKTRRKNKDDTVNDSYYWPIMSFQQVATKLDANRQPHVIQPYVVPPAMNDEFVRHDEAVHSLWMHFVDLCAATAASTNAHDCESMPCFVAPDIATNAYTKLPRLQVFRTLSAAQGRSLSREQLLGTEPVPPLPVVNMHMQQRQRKAMQLGCPQPRMSLVRSESPNAVSNVLSPSHYLVNKAAPQHQGFFSHDDFGAPFNNFVPRHRMPMFF